MNVRRLPIQLRWMRGGGRLPKALDDYDVARENYPERCVELFLSCWAASGFFYFQGCLRSEAHLLNKKSFFVDYCIRVFALFVGISVRIMIAEISKHLILTIFYLLVD